MPRRFEWDENKNRANRRKHGLSFEEAKEIFDGLTFTAPDTRVDYGEQRFISIGLIEGVVAIAVVYTDRSGVTRIISARKANRKERKIYHAHLQRTAQRT